MEYNLQKYWITNWILKLTQYCESTILPLRKKSLVFQSLKSGSYPTRASFVHLPDSSPPLVFRFPLPLLSTSESLELLISSFPLWITFSIQLIIQGSAHTLGKHSIFLKSSTTPVQTSLSSLTYCWYLFYTQFSIVCGNTRGLMTPKKKTVSFAPLGLAVGLWTAEVTCWSWKSN